MHDIFRMQSVESFCQHFVFEHGDYSELSILGVYCFNSHQREYLCAA